VRARRILGGVAWLASASLAASACGEGQNECGAARDKIDVCDAQAKPGGRIVDSLPLFTLGNDSCSREDVCASTCLIQMNCDEIRQALLWGRTTDPNAAPLTPAEADRTRCVYGCYGEEDLLPPEPVAQTAE
jgi:hypothetical protein